MKTNNMFSKITAILLFAVIMFCAIPTAVLAKQSVERNKTSVDAHYFDPQKSSASTDDTMPHAAQIRKNMPSAQIQVVIFHTNDTHGRIVSDGKNTIGIDYIAGIRKNTANSILVDAGDTLHGLPIAVFSKGSDIIALMNEAGYDAMAVGNHEFNYGWERLAKLQTKAHFPLLASNITRNGVPLLSDTAIIEISNVKIGLFGITTEATRESTMPRYVAGLVFHNPKAAAREKVEYLRRQGVQLVVALCHLGVDPYGGTLSTELAQTVPEIDVIIDGHSHTALENGIMENGVLIAQAGEYQHNLGKVTVTLKDGRIIAKTASLISYDEAVARTVPDQAVAAKLAEITARLEVILSEPVGEALENMSSMRAPGVRTQEMPLGNIIADAYREAASVDIAVVNGGDIRADVVAGVITKGDVISILPFGNTLIVKKITPAILYDALENSVSGITVDNSGNIDHEGSAQGRFLHVSGFSFIYDPALPAGERVLFIILDDSTVLSPDDNKTELRLVGSNYIMTGGDYYAMLGKLPIERELAAADEALLEYVRRHSPITAPEADRITVVIAADAQKTAA